MRKHADIPLTREQAKAAVKMCLDNVGRLLKAADEFQRTGNETLLLFTQFALEEAGKAIIIIEKLKATEKGITITSEDCMFDHKHKARLAAARLEEEKSVLVFSDDFATGDFAVAPVVQDTFISFKDRAGEGHRIRLDATFVNFAEKTHEPILEPIDKAHWVPLYVSVIRLHQRLKRDPIAN